MMNINALRKKVRGGGEGFTLVEMLIVVAIIAILVAVSIPLVGNSLDKAEQAADDANERAAKAVTTLVYMEQVTITNITKAELEAGSPDIYYDAANGTLTKSKPTSAYGKKNDGKVIKVSMAGGVFTPTWTN